jgi:hypothetical protein
MDLDHIDRFPLCWPSGWPRTSPDKRRDARFDTSFERGRTQLVGTLKKMGARKHNIVISTNVPLRRDGQPYASQSELGRWEDVGVAVYWIDESGGKAVSRVMACDQWTTVADNLRAIGASLEALRSLQRWGSTSIMDRAFAGFVALPESTKRHWRDVLGLTTNGVSGFSITRTDIDVAYRAKAARCHPDAGGSHDAMVELNRAREEALQAIA